jgi:hypothetical protein
MKKAAMLFVVTVMLGLSSTSYGYFLVYDIWSTISGVDANDDKETLNLKGYLVLNLDIDTDELVDANMFIYGKDPNNHKFYVLLNASDSNGFLDAGIWYRVKKNFYELNGKGPFDFKIVIKGDPHTKSSSIGLSVDKKVASSMYGVISSEVSIYLSLEQRMAATGSISASLYSTATKESNNPNNSEAPWSQDEVVDELKLILDDRSYRQLYVPPPD